MSQIAVLVVDDHALFAEALRARLAQEPDLRPLPVAQDPWQVRLQLAVARPDVVVLDVDLGEHSGLDVLEQIHADQPAIHVVMLTGVDMPDQMCRALRRGARAWLPKTVPADHLVRVIRGVVRGEAWLSPELLGRLLTELADRADDPAPPLSDKLAELTAREAEVLQCMVDGLSRAEIAGWLHLSANTVRTHTQNLLVKLGAHSALEAVSMALRTGMRSQAR